MKRKIVIILTGLLLAFAPPAIAMEPFYASVKKIIDGDSLLIVYREKNIKVRLYGVDCPEYNQPFSNKAKALVKERVYGRKVLIQPEYFDTYKRLVAIVKYGDHTLNSELVGAGLAWVYPHFCKKKICKSWKIMEDSARIAKSGIWSGSPPIPPWEWKRMRHGE